MNLKRLSSWLWPIQQALGALGYSHTILAGSAARAVLDACVGRQEFDARDVDLFVAAHGRARRGDLTRVVEAIERSTLARSTGALRLKPRAVTESGARTLDLGIGAHLVTMGAPILSVTVVHDEDHLELNGLLDVDTVRLRLDNTRPLLDALPDLCDFASRPAACATARVVDPHGGYRSWTRGCARVINWGEVGRRPIGNTLRLWRSAEKLGALDAPSWLEAILARSPWRDVTPGGASTSELARDVQKMLSRGTWGAHVRAMSALGVFEAAAPGLHELGLGGSLERAIACPSTRALLGSPGATR